MYTIKEITNAGNSYLELENTTGVSKAQICLNQGGRLSDFIFNHIQILAPLTAQTYAVHYASSILFPFANRIKNGAFTFNDVNYQLACNEVEKNNALHGLVYNKIFSCEHQEVSASHAAVTLSYTGNGLQQGFPFKYRIKLNYTLNNQGLQLAVQIDNVDTQPFPFTVGWHPYFLSESLENSSINFDSVVTYKTDEQQIITDTIPWNQEMPWLLNEKQLDDCYALRTHVIDFYTPAYKLSMISSAPKNFLQLYTPQQPNVIAIEPMTGITDCFNNGIGLQILHPKDTFRVQWDVSIQPVMN